jgi:xanthine/uracil/vitamin C permease (AzgA family)
VGALMMMNVVRIKWEQSAQALPAFITIILMPLTYSIAYGEQLLCLKSRLLKSFTSQNALPAFTTIILLPLTSSIAYRARCFLFQGLKFSRSNCGSGCQNLNPNSRTFTRACMRFAKTASWGCSSSLS